MILGVVLGLSVLLHIPLGIRAFQYRQHLNGCLTAVVDKHYEDRRSSSEGMVNIDLNDNDETPDTESSRALLATGLSNESYSGPSVTTTSL